MSGCVAPRLPGLGAGRRDRKGSGVAQGGQKPIPAPQMTREKRRKSRPAARFAPNLPSLQTNANWSEANGGALPNAQERRIRSGLESHGIHPTPLAPNPGAKRQPANRDSGPKERQSGEACRQICRANSAPGSMVGRIEDHGQRNGPGQHGEERSSQQDAKGSHREQQEQQRHRVPTVSKDVPSVPRNLAP